MWKRALDLTGAALAMLPAAPLMAACALAVRLDSPGPVFHRGLRMGRDGRTFHILKFRTMRMGAAAAGPAITVAGDPRVTRVGRVLRGAKLDELPQLINVLRGEMSLVGPRPEHPDFLPYYSAEQREVLTVRPGITSPASVAFRSEESVLTGDDPIGRYTAEVLPAKLDLDLAYVRGMSLVTDLRVLAATARRLVGGGS